MANPYDARGSIQKLYETALRDGNPELAIIYKRSIQRLERDMIADFIKKYADPPAKRDRL